MGNSYAQAFSKEEIQMINNNKMKTCSTVFVLKEIQAKQFLNTNVWLLVGLLYHYCVWKQYDSMYEEP